jgi:hypothetical protein
MAAAQERLRPFSAMSRPAPATTAITAAPPTADDAADVAASTSEEQEHEDRQALFNNLSAQADALRQEIAVREIELRCLRDVVPRIFLRLQPLAAVSNPG